MYILVIGIIIIAILIFYICKRKSTSNNLPSNEVSKKENYKINNCYDLFSNVLDNTLTFIDAYLSAMPDEWLFINISIQSEKDELSSNSHWSVKEFIEFEVSVGTWYNGLLYKNPSVMDYMNHIYNFDPFENVFKYKFEIARATDCNIPNEIIINKLFEFLDTYEAEHPTRKLNRTSYGIYHKWN